MASIASPGQSSREGIVSPDPVRAAREWFELTAAMSPFITLVVDATDGRVVHANQAYADALGEDLRGLLGRSIMDSAPIDELPAMRERALAMRTGTLRRWTLTRRVQRRDGSTFMTQLGLTGLVDASDTVRYVLVQARPLDELPKLDPDGAGRVLAFLQPLLRCSADLVALLDVAGRTVWAGKSLREWLADDAVQHGADIFDTVPHDDALRLATFVATAAKSAGVIGPCRISMGNEGALRDVEVFGCGLPADASLVFALVRRCDVAAAPTASPRERALEQTLREIVRAAAEVLSEPDGVREALPPEVETLTPREREILLMLLRGHRVSTIASRLYLAPGTVRNYLSRIFQKLGVRSQAELLDRLHDTSRDRAAVDGT
ncbi:MAG TPA: LuxR C-terminal-related transcriptional regulator [Acidimicrobiia bacterium]|jgi:PAS domain S-box-containing protein